MTGEDFRKVIREEAKELGELLIEKNAAYGNAYVGIGAVLKILYPKRITPDQYCDIPAIVRILDKMFRIATGRSDDVENWGDVSGHALLMEMLKKYKENNEED